MDVVNIGGWMCTGGGVTGTNMFQDGVCVFLSVLPFGLTVCLQLCCVCSQVWRLFLKH